MIHYSILKTRFGDITLASVQEGVCYIGLPDSDPEEMKSWCRKHLMEDEFVLSREWSFSAEKQILEYFEGRRQQFTFPVFHLNTVFRKTVLDAVAQIPYGETASYGDIAKKINKPKASRAVGSANATNPLPLIYPCHRVIAGDGTLGGYGGALELKQALIDLERNNKLSGL
ncbi:MAG: methylated-DNA--[protein]-cysteine S-methyltransferase [Candidatus Marinimicrobia bacterium]|nr:methylated-DNA--[protein]-cysteine S-methyltransferase [Candidatus Neomarinimicrobiota bacterium]